MALKTSMKLSLRVQVLLSFAIVILLVLLMIGITGLQVRDAQSTVDDFRPMSDQTRNIQTFSLTLRELDSNLVQLFAIGGIEQNITTDLATLNTAFERMQEQSTATLDPILTELETVLETLQSNLDPILDDDTTISNAALNRRIIAVYGAIDAADQLAQQLTTANLNELNDNIDEQEDRLETTFGMINIVGPIVLALIVIISIFWSGRVSKPIKKLRDTVRTIADGDLEGEVDVKSYNEVGELAMTFNAMTHDLNAIINEVARVSNEMAAGNLDTALEVEMKGDFSAIQRANERMITSLSQLVNQVKSAARELADTSQDLASSSEEMNASTEQVSAAIQQISKNASDQASKVEQSTMIMREMVAAVDIVTDQARETSETAKRTSASGERGRQAVQDAVAKMESIQTVVNRSAATIRELGSRSEEIGQIVDVITGISDQTNLLALNAAIEAARAGEHGRGFAVVAEEVKNLAEDSRQAAARIAGMIAEIQSETQGAVAAMEHGTKEVESGMAAVGQTDEAFNEIVAMAKATAEQIDEIAGAMGEQKAGTDMMAAAFDSVATIAEETASASQESASSTEELTASMEEVTARAQALSKMALQLEKSAGQFRVRQAGAAGSKRSKDPKQRMRGSRRVRSRSGRMRDARPRPRGARERSASQLQVPDRVITSLRKRGLEPE